MLKYAIIFALISLAAGALGFSGVAAGAAGLQPGCCAQGRSFIGLLACAHIAARYELRPRTESRAMRGGLTALLLHAVQQPCPYVPR